MGRELLCRPVCRRLVHNSSGGRTGRPRLFHTAPIPIGWAGCCFWNIAIASFRLRSTVSSLGRDWSPGGGYSHLCRGSGEKSVLDLTFGDYCGTKYHLYQTDGKEDSLNLSLWLPAFDQLLGLGLQEHLQTRLGNVIQIVLPEPSYQLTVQFQRSAINRTLTASCCA